MNPTQILNARLVNEGREFDSGLCNAHGGIEQIGSELVARDGENLVEAAERRLLPGMIGDQVHFREPGLVVKTDMAIESAAAVTGGLTRFMDMPDPNPPTLDRDALEDDYRRACGCCGASFGSCVGASNDNLADVRVIDPAPQAGGRIAAGDQRAERPAAAAVRSLKRSFTRVLLLALLLATTLTVAAPAQQRADTALPPATLRDAADALGIVFPTSVSQGAMVIGKVPAGSVVQYASRTLLVTPYGSVVFGVGRDEAGPLQVSVQPPNAPIQLVRIAVTARDWPIESIRGVPPATVNPPKAIAERIAREQARVVAARDRDDARTGFAQAFIWPVQGRVSGRFGNQRVYNGTPKSPHSGMDIAAPTGTPVKAPADGVITFVDPGLYLTGGTVVLDHGHGISSNFLHLSRIDVKVGDSVRQGDVIAAVGATGRVTGPHLHWGMSWFETRIDPLLVLDRSVVRRTCDGESARSGSGRDVESRRKHPAIGAVSGMGYRD